MSIVAAVIPTLYRPPQLAPLVEMLEEEGVDVFVLESGDYDHQIHRMWNAGIDRAREIGATEVVVLNDDIYLLPGSIPLMVAVLRADPALGIVYPHQGTPLEAGIPKEWKVELTQGSARVGAMTGFCFMFKAEIDLRFDEAYHWWYGDDTFEEQVRQLGYGVGRIIGLPIGHEQSTSLKQRWSEIEPMIREDSALWRQRHGG
jgi:GT2 family glycosyltransferase